MSDVKNTSSSGSPVILDLREIVAGMGAHARFVREEEIRGQCLCGEPVFPTQDACPACARPVIWYNSRVWKSLYGSPAARVRALSVVLPRDSREAQLLSLLRIGAFPNGNVADRARELLDTIGLERMLWAARTATGGKRRGGLPALYATLSIAERIALHKIQPETQPAPEHRYPDEDDDALEIVI